MMCEWGGCPYTCSKVKGQLWGVNYLLLPLHRFQGLNADHQACTKVPLSAESLLEQAYVYRTIEQMVQRSIMHSHKHKGAAPLLLTSYIGIGRLLLLMGHC